MSDNVTNNDNHEYVYLTIPAEYVHIYHKLLVYVADFGKPIIDDCTASCKGNSKNIITCWNLFQSAIACRALGRLQEADFFIDYINKQINHIYRGTDENVHVSPVIPVDDKGRLTAIVDCGVNSTFFVDINNGRLYQEIDSK